MSKADQAQELLRAFAVRGRRYLWTDAFAVCTWLGLGDRGAALRLVDDVHHGLGRHRPDDARTGWISGLPEAEAERRPTAGGLRIGKPLPERGPDEPFDERLEWKRDGQYFHYLTKWMHALDCAGLAAWARELAEVARRRFTHGRRLYWKMSIDLTRPLVASMGQHDPLDGLATGLALGLDVLEYRAMIEPRALASADPLGIGGLLFDAHRLARRDEPALYEAAADAALLGLRAYVEGPDLREPAEGRLAFRELGLAIGLAAIPSLPPGRTVAELARFEPLRERIEAFWLLPEHRATETWREHADINDVMLATCLVPGGFLRLPPAA